MPNGIETPNAESSVELAHRLGLDALSPENLGLLVRAKVLAERLVAALDRDLPVDEVPAFQFDPRQQDPECS